MALAFAFFCFSVKGRLSGSPCCVCAGAEASGAFAGGFVALAALLSAAGAELAGVEGGVAWAGAGLALESTGWEGDWAAANALASVRLSNSEKNRQKQRDFMGKKHSRANTSTS